MTLFEKMGYVVIFFVLFYNFGYWRGRGKALSYLRKVIPNVDMTLEAEERRKSLGYRPRP